jgi:hypothetical protein
MSEEAISSAEQKIERARESTPGSSMLPTQEESLFLRQNDYWIVRYHGHTAFLKSTRGLRYLAVLLRNSGLYAGIPVLDARAKAEYKCRLNELQQDLNEAERFNDPLRRTEAQNEIQMITDRLASAVGLGGRDRKTSSDAERARSAVTKCIRKAIQKIGDAIPSLGYHLAARIKTGYFCSYNPHPDRPVAWKF